MFTIEMLSAGHGDCLLLEYGDATAPHRVLIDAGPYYAFKECAWRIDTLVSSGLGFELLVVTHVDTDHIDGAIKLLDAPPTGIHFDDVWFNTWRHLRPGRSQTTDQADKLGPVHGEMLSGLIDLRKLPWNKAFGGGPVSLGEGAALPVKKLGGGLTLTLLSPSPEELLALEAVWQADVVSQGLEPGNRDDALKKLEKDARYHKPKDLLGDETPDMDKLLKTKFEEHMTESNASSIAFLAEYGDKSCLFAADALPSTLAASVKRLLKDRQEQKLHVDAVKVSHHGSRGNTSPELLRLLDCRHFLVSTNGAGKSAHPHAETIARIIKECGPGAELWFNYRSDENKVWDDQILIKRHQYVPHYPEEGLVVPLSDL